MRFPSCVTPISPQRVAQTENFYIFCVAYDIFVEGNHHRHFKFGMPIDHSKSQPRDDKLSLKWAWSGHVSQLHFGGHQSYIRKS